MMTLSARRPAVPLVVSRFSRRWLRRRGDLLALAVFAGLVGSGVVVLQSTNAAFTAVTSNSGDTWNAGTVVLADDDSSAAMFAAAHLVPGATGTKCLAVSYTGSLPAVVKLYATAPTGTLAPDLQLTVEQSTGGSFADCSAFNGAGATTLFSGTLAAFAAQSYSWASGVGAWSPTGAGQSRVFRLTWTLSNSVADSQQGATAGTSFVWEARS